MNASGVGAVMPVRATIASLLPSWHPPAWLGYVLRVWAAAALTLYLAFWLELATPYSAVTTVFIVANPVRGAIVSKSAWRLAGTVIGGVVAVVQFALFAQSPLLFDLMLAAWVGVTCFGSTLLRFFPSYGTVLAGYTVAIIDVGALSIPDQVLSVTLDRVSVVALGVVVTGLVFLVTQRARPPSAFGDDIAASTVRLVALLRDVLDGEGLESIRARRRAIAVELTGYDQAIAYASADDLEVRAKSRALRVALADLLAALTNGVRSGLMLRDRAGDEAQDAIPGRLTEALRSVETHARGDRAPARAELAAAAAAFAAMRERSGSLDGLAAAELARVTVERLDNVLLDLDRAAGRGRPDIRLRQYLDWASATRNALRGSLAAAFCCLFWYLTYWPEGPTLLVYVVPAAGLLATTPSPGGASIRFVQGTLIAVPLAILCQSVILPLATDFVPAVLILLIFAAPGIALQLSPVWGLAAFSYLVFFNTNLGLENAMVFDLPRLLANGEAYLLGTVSLLLAFRVLLPPDPVAAVRRVTSALGREGERLARRRRLPDPRVWENLQVQRLLLIGQRLDAMRSTRRGAVIEDAAAGMIVGRNVMRVRGVLAGNSIGAVAARAAREALEAIDGLRRDPRGCARRLDEAAGRVRQDEPAPDRLRLAALLHLTARLIEAHADVFDRDLRLDDFGAPVGTF